MELDVIVVNATPHKRLRHQARDLIVKIIFFPVTRYEIVD
jgi:hypothetical protein